MPENAAANAGPIEVEAKHRRANPVARLGCGLLLACWFILLMTPCALFYLAANGEIRIWHTDIPQPYAHPRLLISLVSEADNRGLRIESSSIAASPTDESAVCIQTLVRFVLWETSDSSRDVSYCDCYQRADAEADWEMDSTFAGDC